MGIFASDGRPKAAIYECKHVFQPAECSLVDAGNGLIKIINHNAVASLGGYLVNLQVLENGKIISDKMMPAILLPAGHDTAMSIASYLRKLKPGVEFLANIKFMLSGDQPWASKGFELAHDQFALTGLAHVRHERESFPAITSSHESGTAVLSGKGFKAAFNEANGALVFYIYDGKVQVLLLFCRILAGPLRIMIIVVGKPIRSLPHDITLRN